MATESLLRLLLEGQFHHRLRCVDFSSPYYHEMKQSNQFQTHSLKVSNKEKIYKLPIAIFVPMIPMQIPAKADPKANLTSRFSPFVASAFFLIAPRNMRAGKM